MKPLVHIELAVLGQPRKEERTDGPTDGQFNYYMPGAYKG
jgi:hypothetical protein